MSAVGQPAASERSNLAGSLAWIYLGLILFASLSPFTGWRVPDGPPLAYLWAPWPRRWLADDVVINILAYLPFGMLLALSARRRHGRVRAFFTAVIVATFLSAAMEALQAFLPVRVSSNVDLLCNSGGAAAGALAGVLFGGSAGAGWLDRTRRRIFESGSWADTGLALLLLWLLSQVNPSIPFLGAGVVANPLTEPWNAAHDSALTWAPQGAAVALGFCGIGLFASALVRHRVAGFGLSLLLLATAFLIKLAAAGLLLKSIVALDWLGPDTRVGLTIGFVLLALFAFLPARARVYIAAVCVLAGALMAKLSGNYLELGDAFKLFNWPYGQLLNFTGLTVLLNELWPILAFVFLLMYGSHPRRRTGDGGSAGGFAPPPV